MDQLSDHTGYPYPLDPGRFSLYRAYLRIVTVVLFCCLVGYGTMRFGDVRSLPEWFVKDGGPYLAGTGSIHDVSWFYMAGAETFDPSAHVAIQFLQYTVARLTDPLILGPLVVFGVITVVLQRRYVGVRDGYSTDRYWYDSF